MKSEHRQTNRPASASEGHNLQTAGTLFGGILEEVEGGTVSRESGRIETWNCGP